jgi:hypothetical protein
MRSPSAWRYRTGTLPEKSPVDQRRLSPQKVRKRKRIADKTKKRWVETNHGSATVVGLSRAQSIGTDF